MWNSDTRDLTIRTVFSDSYNTLNQRLEIYSKSVIPSSLKAWNELDLTIRNSQSLSIFKKRLNRKFGTTAIPPYFLTGERFASVHHARIRNSCSNLNADLFNNHLKDSSLCVCGDGIENAEHFFFNCKKYSNERVQFFRSTQVFHPLSTRKLLHGIPELNDNQNKKLFGEVQKFIKNTKRFASNT